MAYGKLFLAITRYRASIVATARSFPCATRIRTDVGFGVCNYFFANLSDVGN